LERNKLLNSINKKLSIWAVELELDSSVNKHDNAITSENIVAKLLNCIYELNLENINEEKLNSAGVDLIDKRNHYLVQVTTTSLNKAKTQKTYSGISDVLRNDYRLIIFSLVKETPHWSKSSHKLDIRKNIKNGILNNVNVTFDPESSYLDLKMINEKLNLSAEITNTQLTSVLGILDEAVSGNDISEDPLILEQIISELAKKNIQLNGNRTIQNTTFEIQDKIDYNELSEMTDYILDRSSMSYIFDSIYQSFRLQGKQADETVFDILAQLFLFDDDVSAAHSPIKKFGKLINALTQYLEENGTGFFNSNNQQLGHDELLKLNAYIVVDAFNRCKIFKKPKKQ